MSVLNTLQQRHRDKKKSIAVLVDPDKAEDPARLQHLINLASENCVDYFFVGGSLVTSTNLSEVVRRIKENVTIP
ncbi:MAG: geranylgeranylglyceryl/heptaprenylglyceryl phosphate synthase, partial [Cyclobacteriaceae bacterium]